LFRACDVLSFITSIIIIVRSRRRRLLSSVVVVAAVGNAGIVALVLCVRGDGFETSFVSRRKESVADDASEEVEKKQSPRGVTNWIRLENVLVGVQSVVLFFSRRLFFFSARSKREKAFFAFRSATSKVRGGKASQSSSRSSDSESDLSELVPDVKIARDVTSTTLNVVRRFQVDVAKPPDDNNNDKSPANYCKLPANQYNVIDEDKVEMLEDNSFVVSTGVQKFLFLTIEAKGRVKIEETLTGVKQTLEKAEMIDVNGKNGKIVDAMNKSIGRVRVVNSVVATTSDEGRKEHIESQLEFSGTFTDGVFAKIGPRLNEIASFVLGATLPWFLETIGKDYELWAVDGERQKAKMDIGGMSQTILKGAKGKLPSNVREIEVV